MLTCPWPIDIESCCNEKGIDFEDESTQELAGQAIAQASQMLSTWSGRRFGGCHTVRPLDPCGECRSGCCSSGDCIVLHDASAVLEVRVGGQIVDDSEYGFDAARGTLCAVPPKRWPMRDPRHEAVPSMEVDVMVGEEPDAWALAVATELACELLASCLGSSKCRLPRNVTQVSSQGIVITMDHDELKFALPSVVAWVSAVNPDRATRPARVLSAEARSRKVHGNAPARFSPWG